MLMTVNAACPNKQPLMMRVLRVFRSRIDAFTGSRMQRVRAGSRTRARRLARTIESLPRIVSRLSRQFAVHMLTATLGLLALAAIFALQAAFYVYVWRLPN
jgi:hypothetical protein